MDLVELIVLKVWTIGDSRIEFKETLRVLCVFQGCALFRQRPTQPFAVTQPKPFSHDQDFVTADHGLAAFAAAAASLDGDQALPRRQIGIERKLPLMTSEWRSFAPRISTSEAGNDESVVVHVLQKFEMVLADGNDSLFAQPAYFGGKRTPLYTEEIGERLPVERYLELQRVVANRLAASAGIASE
jgi:hypothetical protein